MTSRYVASRIFLMVQIAGGGARYPYLSRHRDYERCRLTSLREVFGEV